MNDRLFAFASLGKPTIENLMKNYDVGVCQSFAACKGGLINSNFRLVMSKGTYLLRIYAHERTLPQINFELSLLAELAHQGFQAQKPVRRKDGDFITQLGEQWCSLLTFLPGSTLSGRELTSTMVHQIGQAVAHMQNALEHFTPQGVKSNADFELIQQLTEHALQTCRDKPALQQIVANLEEQWQILSKLFAWPKVFKKGLVHADLSVDNVLFDGENFSGLIDFDDAYLGWLVGDVALMLMEFSFDAHQNPDLNLAEKILLGYTGIRALSSQEVEHLYPMMQLLSFKYFAYLLPLANGNPDEISNNTYVKRILRLQDPAIETSFCEVIQRACSAHRQSDASIQN